MDDRIKELNKILPVVIRVHGPYHGELNKVGELYTAITSDEKSKEEQLALAAELKKVSNNFEVPADACPTFGKAYKLLKDLIEDIEK